MNRIVALSLVVLGCADVPASNPFDPATPKASQSKSSLQGTLLLERGFDRGVLEALEIRLTSTAGAGIAAAVTVSDETPEEGAPWVGVFSFADLSAGLWLLELQAPAFHAVALPLEVEIGQPRTLDPILLKPIGGADEQAVELSGRVELEGRSHHGGALVELLETPFATSTTGEGRFSLRVGPGTYTLRISAAEYEDLEAPDLELVVGRLDLEEAQGGPLRLVALPAQLRGRITASVPGGGSAPAGGRGSRCARARRSSPAQRLALMDATAWTASPRGPTTWRSSGPATRRGSSQLGWWAAAATWWTPGWTSLRRP